MSDIRKAKSTTGRWLFKSLARIHSCISYPQIFVRTSNFQKQNSIDLTQITLRPLNLSDLDDLMLCETDEKVANLCCEEPYITNKEEGIDFIENIAPTFQLCKAICLNDRVIGHITIFRDITYDERTKKSAELGYVLGSKYWGKGITTCVVKQVVKIVFTEFSHLERLEALVLVENVGSQRVLEKAGFQKEGVLRKYWFMKGKSRDVIMFSLLSTDLQL